MEQSEILLIKDVCESLSAEEEVVEEEDEIIFDPSKTVIVFPEAHWSFF